MCLESSVNLGRYSHVMDHPLLYPGEILDTVAGYPTLYRYQPGSTSQGKPLIVCVTGGLHLARVFYGGHRGSRPSDFLAYWLSNLGYGVLSISYPLETDPGIMPATAAGFRIRDWGRQAAITTEKIIKENDLPLRSVVLISWSMGGRMVVPFNIAAKERGLEVLQYISFAATPGFSSIRPLPPGIQCSPAGYFRVPPHIDVFWHQLVEMQGLNGGREIIPKDIYLREYIGGTPINIIGLGLKYDGKGAFVQDEVPHEEDTRVLDVANYPLISALYPTSSLDASHALADKASWGFLLTYKLETMIGKQGLRRVQGTQKWQQLMDLVHSAPGRLCLPVSGNHFFFVGEASARDIATKVESLISDAARFRNEIFALVS
ncbi:thioesterase domain protein [Aspergillus lucknowensis]|uniref:AB hydrolase-1 domain-containing protein n=1 Tax=Aspergillus lucknowensis TaxID=176173 RepID=A0ABR4M536_9EURO